MPPLTDSTTLQDSLPHLAASTDLASLPAGRKIGFVHLGCAKNLVDTETMLGLLAKDGHTLVQDETEADVVLVNTCAFIEKAQEESVEALATLAEQGKKLLITGCLAQKFQGELLDLFPEAEAVVGIDQVPDIASIVRQTSQGERVLAVQQDPTFLLEEDHVRQHVTLGPWVYLKIAEGCDYRCTFCIIPSMRGDFRSRPIANVVENARQLVASGARELILVGQDTTSYGKDHGETLAQLLYALNEIKDLQWIRILYAYPTNVTDDLLKAFAECEKVVKILDCPLQHSHPEMLKRMGRPINDLADFAQRVRGAVPGIRLRSTFIVGFPGETEAHVQHLIETLQSVKFDRVGVFEYSDVDTAASQHLDGKVAKREIKQRRSRVMAAQQTVSYELHQALVGQILPVMIDLVRENGLLQGRTQWDAPEVDPVVTVKVPKTHMSGELMPGQIAQVSISGATPYDLRGVLETPPS
ncbi:MAG: 30S ribosomal protein S12 methylthiotransferase RimO [Vampirovibrionales bacterium]|nr:30S ribosomal protein S12 methylthiotransferase RimO [Vampirovibrionales bacterium]